MVERESLRLPDTIEDRVRELGDHVPPNEERSVHTSRMATTEMRGKRRA